MAIRVITGTIATDSDAELLTFGGNVIQQFTDNPLVFVLSDPTVPVLTGLHGDFETAVQNAVDGGETETATKNMVRRPYENGLRVAGAYVEKTANAANGGNGDVSIVYLGGFKPRKTPAPKGDVGIPPNLRLKHGANSGELDAKADPVDGAATYEWRYATAAAPTAWQDGGTSTGARKTLKGLIPGTVYTVQLRAVGTSGRSDWSDPAVLMAV
jgi:hypothetical protein